MKKFIGVIAVAVALFAVLPAGAAVYTLSDGNSTATIDPTSSGNMNSWVVDGVNQVFQQTFFIGLGTAPAANLSTSSTGASTFLGTRGLDSTYSGAGFTAEVLYIMSGGAAGSGTSDIGETIRIQNTSGQSLTFRFFQYNDFDIGGLGGDTAVLVNPGRIDQFDPNYNFTEVISTPVPNHYMIGQWPNVLSQITAFGFLPDSALFTGPGDVSWAWEWDVTLGAGTTYIISKDKNVQPVPEPGTMMLLGSGLIGLAGWGRKKFRK